MSDDYDLVYTSSLKLKQEGGKVGKKKKKKSKPVQQLPPSVTTKPTTCSSSSDPVAASKCVKTRIIVRS